MTLEVTLEVTLDVTLEVTLHKATRKLACQTRYKCVDVFGSHEVKSENCWKSGLLLKSTKVLSK